MVRALRQIKNFICVLMLLVSCLGLTWTTVTEAAQVDEKSGTKTVRLAYLISPGYQEGVGPMELKQGYGYDYYQKLSYLTGWKYEYVYGNFGELLEKLKKGDIDMMGNLSYTPERAKDILFSAEEMGRESFYFYTKLKDMDKFSHGIADFNNKNIGVNDQSFQAKLLEKWLEDYNITGTKIIRHKSKEERYQMFNSGVTDIVVSTMLSHRDSKNADWVTVQKLGEAPFFIGISKRRPDLLEELNVAQHRLLAIEPEFNTTNYNKYMHGVAANSTFLFANEKKWLQEHPVVKVGYIAKCMPFCWVDEKTGEMAGALTFIFDDFEKRYNVKTKRIPFKHPMEMLKALKAGDIDIMSPSFGSYWMAENNGLANSMDIISGDVLLLYKGTYRDSLTKKVAISFDNLIGTTYTLAFLPKAQQEKYFTVDDACDAIEAGKVESIIMLDSQYNLLRRAHPGLRELNTATLPNKMELKLTTAYSPALLGLINKQLALMEKDKFENALASINIPLKLTWKQMISRNLVGLSFVIFVILGVLGVAFWWYYRVTAEKNRVLTEAKENVEKMLAKEKALREELEQARNEADHDALTGLWNKGSFENMMKLYRSSRNIAILVVDFDDFKNVNDNYGHDVGDKVLQYVSNVLLDCFRTSDYVCRIGGDEFAVIMTNITSGQKDIVAEKMTRIQKLVASTPDDLPKISVSMGCAFSDSRDLKDAREIFRFADKALYTVKKNDKNGFAFYN